MSYVQFNAKLKPEVNDKLNFICNAYGIGRSAFLVSAINSEYDKLHGNSELIEAVEKLRSISDIFKSFSGENSP